MTPPFHFAVQRTSWDADNRCVRPGSASDLICREIQRHMPEGSYTVGREPLPDRINIYTSTRPAFNTDVRDSERLSVLLGHGCADKNIWARHAPYFDHVITPGPMHTDLVLRGGVPADRIFEGGYPKLDPIFNEEITQNLPNDGRPRVLYAPTHGGGSDMGHYTDTEAPMMGAAKRTSWWRRDELLPLLQGTAWDLIPCPHPRYTAGNKATLHQYVGADVVIADGGSTLLEAIMLGVPLVTPRWIVGKGFRTQQTLEAKLYRTKGIRHAHRPSLLEPLVREAIQDGPSNAEQELSLKVLPCEYRGKAGQRIAEWLHSLGG